MTGDVKIVGGDADSRFCFKNTPFTRSVLHLNDSHIETAGNLELVMKHYNLIKYSDNYQNTVGFLYQFRRDEQPLNDAGVDIVDVTTDNSSSFKYKSRLFNRTKTEDGGAGANAYRIFKNKQILVPLKYTSSFFRSAEIPFINTKIQIELFWKRRCIMSTADENNGTGI